MAKTLSSFTDERTRIKNEYLAGRMSAEEFRIELELLKAEEAFYVKANSTHILASAFGPDHTDEQATRFKVSYLNLNYNDK